MQIIRKVVKYNLKLIVSKLAQMIETLHYSEIFDEINNFTFPKNIDICPMPAKLQKSPWNVFITIIYITLCTHESINIVGIILQFVKMQYKKR